MKKHFSSLLTSIGCVSALAMAFHTETAQAQFAPIGLTPGSYNESMIVPSNYIGPVPTTINCFVGSGFCFSCDTTYYEIGMYSRKPGEYGYNSGVPQHGTVFTNVNNSSMTFLMPPNYFTNDDLVIMNSSSYGVSLSGTLTLATPTTCTHMAVLDTGGNGGCAVNYTVNHVDGSTDTGSYSVPDWFAGGSTGAWGCDGRMNQTGGYENFNASQQNVNPPWLYGNVINVSSSSPVVSVTFSWKSGGGVDNFFAVSTSTDGTTYTPVAVTGFNETTIIQASVPFPVSATLDNGTNIAVDPGTTWFEMGWDTNNPSLGIPSSGTTFASAANPGNTYQTGSFASNDAVLIDSSHLSDNITPVTPASYTGLSFLCSGGNIGGGNIMSNTCLVQHQNGVNETGWVFGYDWFDDDAANFLALAVGERANVGSRVVNNNSPYPYLFESFVVVTNTSPVTNIVVGYGLAPGTTADTVILAVSGATSAWGPFLVEDAAPTTQEWFPGQSATISVDVVGNPLSGQWLVESNGVYVPLNNGRDVNGSTVSGATTQTLTITGLTLADGTNYEFQAMNANGTVDSSPAAITINTGPTYAPSFTAQFPTSSFSVLTNHADVTTFSVTVAAQSSPPIYYQWYSVAGGVTNPIAGATNSTYNNLDTSSVTLYCVASNFVGTATSAPVSVTIVSSIGATSAYASAVTALNPVSYWPLNETGGVIAFDNVGKNDGTYIGGVALGQPGVTGSGAIGQSGSVSFDGTSGYVTIPAGTNALNITGPLSMSQWVLVPFGGENGFTTSFGHSDQSYRISVGSPAQPHFADSGPDIVDGNNIDDGNWHLLVGVYDGNNQYLYVDGVEQGGTATSEPTGRSIPLTIAAAPDYGPGRFFAGNICQCAVFNYALSPAQVTSLYNAMDLPPGNLTVTPAAPTVFVGRSVSLSATTTLGDPVTSYQWYVLPAAGGSNLITGATNMTYTLTNASNDENGETIGVIAGNSWGSVNASVVLTVVDVAASVVSDLMPTNAEAVVGTTVTYSVNAGGSLPIDYQWTMDGSPVSGATNSTYSFAAQSGTHVIQVSFTNTLSAGTPVVSSKASLTGVSTTPAITFNNGAGWVTNTAVPGSTVPYFTNNALVLTDGLGGEGDDAIYSVGQYVGSFTASFVYTVVAYSIPAADGTTFFIEDAGSATNALGGGGGSLGYAPSVTNSLALELDLYNAVGITAESNGVTYANGGPLYGGTGKVTLDSGDPIQFDVSWAQGVLGVKLTDLTTAATYVTNYSVGPLLPILGANLAYIGFSGGDGGAVSVQTISDFQFNPGGTVVSRPTLTISDKTSSSFLISWPTAAGSYSLQQASSLNGPWTAGPAPTVVGASNTVSIAIPGTGSGQFYRLALPD